jgi:DNA-directed RNA polymerase specialized sigma24 family protein
MGRNEIAEMFGISEYNVKMRLYRAKKELVDRFERLLRKSG